MPGKFEGEPEWAKELYDMMLDGSDETYYDENDRPIDYFAIDAIDADEMVAPELDNKHIILWEDDNGFVYTKVFNSEHAAKNYMKESLGVPT